MKRTILIRDVTYSNHAKKTFGMAKMTQQATMKMVTNRQVSIEMARVVLRAGAL